MSEEKPVIAAILVAGGSGTRFGGETPKQYTILCGQPVLRHAAAALAPLVSLLQPVGDPARLAEALAGIAHLPAVAGGAQRQDSVRAGLEALAPHEPDIVLIHDAARPFIPAGTAEAVISALARHEGAIPALPVSDTLKRGVDGISRGSVPREGLYRAQTPQGFRFGLLLGLHRRAGDSLATDDASLLEQAGHEVALVPGSEDNIKLTVTEDLVRLERIIGGTLQPRIGTGFDVHAMAPDRRLILCGIEVPHELGLAGHSDADVGIHALCDAIYGAMAEGDIGRHFPPSQAAWKDADSARFLRHAAGLVRSKGGIIANADLTIICERPKITPHAPAMRARLAELMEIGIDRVSVKATTTERLGFTGRGEGIAAQAAATILLPNL
ncbi:MAG TPA: bifunctional 2-C-methyl-D-erythritol 4-phosphate cytidylyltransferase/2-C-methyl-D-erythritol 2,4-cyclodiphosphate synthase [Acetobacteraceae bacterium]|nr:bifunctional 2-C-methyl-D-erythritol 4-phosphate cytidylyltransferase/2-C-methyl-D-erythritol 2,4-cyclodiphosphate synthase [Acetobacteraceae bacterium]